MKVLIFLSDKEIDGSNVNIVWERLRLGFCLYKEFFVTFVLKVTGTAV